MAGRDEAAVSPPLARIRSFRRREPWAQSSLDAFETFAFLRTSVFFSLPRFAILADAAGETSAS